MAINVATICHSEGRNQPATAPRTGPRIETSAVAGSGLLLEEEASRGNRTRRNYSPLPARQT